MSSLPYPPAYWTWERWMHGHSEYRAVGPKHWPSRPNVPRPAPLRWRQRHLRHIVKPPPPPEPVVIPSVFAGRVLMTAWDPEHLFRIGVLAKIDGVCLKGDGSDGSTPAMAARFHAAGKRVLVWEASPSRGQALVDEFGASGYVGQAEGPQQLQAALALEPGLRCQKALVCNTHMTTWPKGWVALGEAYTNVDRNATPLDMAYELGKRGAEEFHPVFGLYDGSGENPSGGRRITVSEYFTMEKGWLDRGNWWGYLGEHLNSGEVP